MLPSQPKRPGTPSTRHCEKAADRCTHSWLGSQHANDTGKLRPAHLRWLVAHCSPGARSMGVNGGDGGRVSGVSTTGGSGAVTSAVLSMVTSQPFRISPIACKYVFRLSSGLRPERVYPYYGVVASKTLYAADQ